MFEISNYVENVIINLDLGYIIEVNVMNIFYCLLTFPCLFYRVKYRKSISINKWFHINKYITFNFTFWVPNMRLTTKQTQSYVILNICYIKHIISKSEY